MRKHAAWYLKGLRGNGRVRKLINQAETKDQLVDILLTYVKELESESKVS